MKKQDLSNEYTMEYRDTISRGEHSWEEIQQMDYFHQRQLEGRTIELFTVVKIGKDAFYFGLYRKYVQTVGRKIFPKTTDSGYIMWKRGKYCRVTLTSPLNAPSLKSLHKAFTKMGVEWYTEYLQRICPSRMHLVLKSSILKSVFLRTITNPRQLSRAVAKRVIGRGDAVEFVRYILENEVSLGTSIRNLLDFVDNPMLWLKNDWEAWLKYDSLNMAVSLGRTIKASWSKARITAEHHKWNRELIRKQLDIPLDTVLVKEVIEEPGFKQAITAQDTWDLSEKYDNCIFSSYTRRIKSGDYLIFEVANQACLGIKMRLNPDTGSKQCVIDQLLGKGNSLVDEDLVAMAQDFVDKHQKKLLKMLKVDTVNSTIEQDEIPW